MIKYFLSFCLILFCNSLFCQENTEDPARTFSNTITPNDLEAHLTFLADDLLEGRATGLRGQHLAALYLATQFKKIGLEPGNKGSYYLNYNLLKSDIDDIKMRIGKKSFYFKGNFFTFGGHGIPNSLSGGFVFAGYGINEEGYDNIASVEVKNKIVLMMAGGPDENKKESLRGQIYKWIARARIVKEKGAKAAMVILPQKAFDRLNGYANPSTIVNISDGDEKGFPLFYLSPAMGETLLANAKTDIATQKALLANDPKVAPLSFRKLKFSYSATIKRERLEGSNVLGFIEGTDKKEELVVITAHMDHIGMDGELVNNGADDDGSGTAALLEIAEAFSKAVAAGMRPRRSILIMPVSGEEKGLWGSAYYTDHPVYPLENTVVDLNIDMIGRIDRSYTNKTDSANYIYLIGSDRLSKDLHEVSEATNSRYTHLTLDYKYNAEDDPNKYYERSDHYHFAEKGIPIIFYFSGSHKDYHRPTDTVDKINFEKAAKITQLVFLTAWEIANREERLVVD